MSWGPYMASLALPDECVPAPLCPSRVYICSLPVTTPWVVWPQQWSPASDALRHLAACDLGKGWLCNPNSAHARLRLLTWAVILGYRCEAFENCCAAWSSLEMQGLLRDNNCGLLIRIHMAAISLHTASRKACGMIYVA